MVEDIRHDAARGRIVLEIIEHPVDLIEISLGIVVLDAQLIAVRLADGTILVSPAVPDMGSQLMHIIRLLLPDPQQLVDAALEEHLAQRHDREFL